MRQKIRYFQEEIIMADQAFVFKKNVPTSCWLDQLYDPDTDGTDPSISGKYILEPSSIVLDRDTNIAYYVESVDGRYKHTLKPLRMLVIDDSRNVSIVSYGNSLYYLFYDDRVRPTQLNIDSKLVFFGQGLAEYRLLRRNASGIDEHISLYIDTDGVPRGERIPLANVPGLDTIKVATNCHTSFVLKDGDVITMQLFDVSGVQSAELTLFAKRATLLNDMAASATPIIEFNAECLQTRGDDFYVYTNQDVTHLNIQPYVIYSDGTRKDIPVDNQKCFIHGLEDFVASFPGYKQPIVIKYHLTPREIALNPIIENRSRFLACIKNIVVVPNITKFTAKLTVIPIWNFTTRSYDLEYYVYTNKRDRIYRVTDSIEYIDNTQFNGCAFGIEQKLTVRIDLQDIYNADDPVIHIQNIYITLKHYSAYERYIIKNSKNDTYAYGVDVTLYRRPVIHYDENIGMYFVPTTIHNNVQSFLEAFYYASRPMYDITTETNPIPPTHFTIRNARNGNMVITAPIPVEQYGQSWNIAIAGDSNQLVGNTVIVEFLSKIGNEEYLLLQGVPVDVYNSIQLNRGGYNTNTNNNLYGV
jgi:hypothetical protein